MIQDLWERHRQRPFPAELKGAAVEGIDVTALDTLASGCIDTFVQQGRLDLWRTALLGLCYRDLALVVRSLEGQAYVYFQPLEEMAGLVLDEVLARERAA